ncbi:MAG: NTP transferase domain-containing protein [Deltaproteobacteria bacterium]|nr:MAG: NTP transferase domain-containing protein [Deltaproteobacteria bacterium]
MRIPAIVAAGDLRAAKAIYGESKIYLELAGLPLVAHVVAVLQRVPEIEEVWVVGDAVRLQRVFADADLASQLRKPLHIVPQFRNLYENAWETYRRLLAGPGSEGRDPEGADLDRRVLYLSADIPFATPQEISEFVRRGAELRCNYAVGLVTEESMEAFYAGSPGAAGIRMAYFNLYEGRFRQSNLHLVQPGRITNRYYIEEMYEHRYQKQFGNIVGLAWRILRIEEGGIRILFYYALMHLAAVADRRGWRRLADWMRRFIPIARVEQALSTLLRASLRFVVTDVGGCAVDIDNEHDFDAAVARFDEWRSMQARRATELYGPLSLPPAASDTREADR